MKKVIFVIFVISLLIGVTIIATEKLQCQNVQTEEKIKQIEKPIPPKPKEDIIPKPIDMDTSSVIDTEKILRLKVWIKSEKEQNVIERIGLPCKGKTECLCHATEDQVEKLKKEGIQFEVQREALRIRKTKNGKGSVSDYNDTDYDIPDNDGWIYSPITFSSEPAGAIVTSIDVRCDIYHTFIGDLIVDLTNEDLTYEVRLWDREGGAGDEIHVDTTGITTFNGELVNQTWKLWAVDCAPGDTGYLDCWDITIWYEVVFPDLIVQSLTASDYNPNVGESIDVTMVIKNQGAVPVSDWFCNGLYYDLSSPPDTNTYEDDWWYTCDLGPGETESYTFYSITSSQPGTWRMYGLADCDGEITESNENNNYKGPVNINWTYVPPDLVVHSLTVEDDSLYITEHTNGTITIKNQSSVPITQEFRTDVLKNSPTAPSPPASGQYRWQTYSLGAGETRTYNFYKLPHSTSHTTWKMWGLVDSQGDIPESNDTNNVYGPVNIAWFDTFTYHEVSRADVIAHGLEFVNVNWTCSNQNTTDHWSCPIWECWFNAGQNYTGEAYSWGGWDKPNTDYLTYLSAGLCVGSIKDSTCGDADPYWATGVDCAGLVCRCWETPVRKDCRDLVYVSDQITVGALQPGDIMNRSTGEHKHVRMFYQWDVPNSWMWVIEATPRQCKTEKYYAQDLLNQGYVPRRYKWIYDPANNDPVITGHIQCKYPLDECGDCIKLGEEMTIEIDAYDPDGDPLFYEWVSYFGHFVVDGETTYVDTTTENYITYLAPVEPWWPDDHLYVSVWDNRGGYDWIDGELKAYEEGYSCLCGDANNDGLVGAGDIVYLISYLHRGGDPPPDPYLRGDANNNCEVEPGDVVYLIAYCFRDGPPAECCWFSPSSREQ